MSRTKNREKLYEEKLNGNLYFTRDSVKNEGDTLIFIDDYESN